MRASLFIAILILAGCGGGASPQPETLHDAAAAGDVQRVRGLIGDGASVDEVNADGRTPLHEAVSNREVEVVRELLSAGADPLAVDGIGRRPLEMCRGYERLEHVLNVAIDETAPAIPDRLSDVAIGNMTAEDVQQALGANTTARLWARQAGRDDLHDRLTEDWRKLVARAKTLQK